MLDCTVDMHHYSVDTAELFHVYFFLSLSITSVLDNSTSHSGKKPESMKSGL